MTDRLTNRPTDRQTQLQAALVGQGANPKCTLRLNRIMIGNNKILLSQRKACNAPYQCSFAIQGQPLTRLVRSLAKFAEGLDRHELGAHFYVGRRAQDVWLVGRLLRQQRT